MGCGRALVGLELVRGWSVVCVGVPACLGWLAGEAVVVVVEDAGEAGGFGRINHTPPPHQLQTHQHAPAPHQSATLSFYKTLLHIFCTAQLDSGCPRSGRTAAGDYCVSSFASLDHW